MGGMLPGWYLGTATNHLKGLQHGADCQAGLQSRSWSEDCQRRTPSGSLLSMRTKHLHRHYHYVIVIMICPINPACQHLADSLHQCNNLQENTLKRWIAINPTKHCDYQCALTYPKSKLAVVPGSCFSSAAVIKGHSMTEQRRMPCSWASSFLTYDLCCAKRCSVFIKL